MIHQIAAHARPIQQHIDPMLAQMRPRSDAGQHQEPRRVQSTGGQHHVVGGDRFDPAGATHLRPGGAAVSEQNAAHLRA